MPCCSRDKPEPTKQQRSSSSIQYDEALAKISTGAAVMQLMLTVDKTTHCNILEAMDKAAAEDARAVPAQPRVLSDDIKDDIRKTTQAECEVFTRVEMAAKPTFDAIKERGRLLEQQYVFSIFLSSGSNADGETTYQKEEMGLFSTLEQCNQIARDAFEQGIPVSKCKSFKDFFPTPTPETGAGKS